MKYSMYTLLLSAVALGTGKQTGNNMANISEISVEEVLPKYGLLFTEQSPMPVLCKPKIMPLKSVTLEKLEKMQKDAEETIKQQEEQTRNQELNDSQSENGDEKS